MCVSKVQQVTAIDNIGPRSDDKEEHEKRIKLGRRLYHAACASFKRNHGITSMLSFAELIDGEISPDRGCAQYLLLAKTTYFTKPHSVTSGRCVIELDGDMLVIMGWRRAHGNSGIIDLAVKVINPDAACIEFLAGDETLDQYNVTAIGERYEVGQPNHPYKKET